MTATWNSLSAEARAATAATFEALTLMDRLSDPMRQKSPDGEEPIGLGALYAYASDPALPLPGSLGLALQRDRRLAKDFARLIGKLSSHQADLQAAASSGAVEHWEGPGFTLDIRTSRAEVSQVYIVVRLSDTAARPGSLFVSQADSTFFKEALPSVPGDTYQLLLDSDADIVRALRDPRSKVFLR